MNLRRLRLRALSWIAPCALAAVGCRTQDDSAPKARTPSSVTPTSSAAPSPVPSAPPATQTEAPQAVAFDVTSPPSLGEPAAVELTPGIPPHERGMLDHAFVVGWSKDSKELGYCMVSGGSGGTHCEFLTPAGKSEKLNDFDDSRGDADPARHAAIEARIAARGYAVTKPLWPHARDLVLTWKLDERQESAGKTTPPRLLVGAAARGKKSFMPSLTLLPPKDGDWFSIHPETIAVSPDGKYVGVISHSFAGEFSDTFAIRILPTSVVAGQAYNDEGLALHREGKFDEAAIWFHRAAHTNPESKVAFYNLACALARSGRPNVEPALRAAIDAGGPEVRTKARTDEDFSSVRGAAWFQNLTTPAKSP